MNRPDTAETVELEAFRLFPHGIIVLGPDGSVLAANDQARELFGPLTATSTCCSLLDCADATGPLGGRCLTELVRERGDILPEVRLDLPGGRGSAAIWVTAAPLEGGRAALGVRPGSPGDRRRRTNPHWVSGPRIRIHALGRTRVESEEGEIGGRWLERRAGQLLKYLAAERHRVAHVDEISEALWLGSGRGSAANVRYVVHNLRRHLEPDLGHRAQSAFVVAREGGYTLDARHVWIDASELERNVQAGLGALARGDSVTGAAALQRAIDIYRGDFLTDELYSQWALPERDRLRAIVSEALDAMVRLCLSTGETDRAWPFVERLAELHPYDMSIHRRRIALALLRGRRSDAVRHHTALRLRMMEIFGEAPDFELRDVRAEDAFA
jgi:DNA-binding SARP family transcriptional activator